MRRQEPDCAVDGSLTEGGSRVGIVARLEQRIAQAQIGLERRGIGSILRSGRESLGGRRVVAHGGERLAAVGEQRAALAVGAVVEGGSIGSAASAYMPDASRRCHEGDRPRP